MRVAITGASGFVGSALVARLTAEGHQVRRIGRGPADRDGDIRWDPAAGRLDGSLRGLDAVVHLAGASIATLWTSRSRAAIYRSRIDGTDLLVRAMAEAGGPRTLVCASAIGYYGDRGDEELTEESPAGTGFLARLCQDWEAAAAAATEHGVRVVSTRFGVIQSTRSGMLRIMSTTSKVGPVARFGHGRRRLSWVSIDDTVDALRFALLTPALSGPVNVTAPHPVTNAGYAAAVARLAHRPVVPVPPPLLRLALRGVADELLLQSALVRPHRLLSHGFTFAHPELLPALEHLRARRA